MEQVVLHVVPTIVQRVIHQQVHVSHVVQIDISVEHNVFFVHQKWQIAMHVQQRVHAQHVPQSIIL